VGQRKCLPLTASLESGLVGTLRPITLLQQTKPPSGPVGYRRRGPVIPTPLPRGIRHWHTSRAVPYIFTIRTGLILTFFPVQDDWTASRIWPLVRCIGRHGLASGFGNLDPNSFLMARSCNIGCHVPLATFADFTLDSNGELDSYHCLRPAKCLFWLLC
jgi:hypothetical protein